MEGDYSCRLPPHDANSGCAQVSLSVAEANDANDTGLPGSHRFIPNANDEDRHLSDSEADKFHQEVARGEAEEEAESALVQVGVTKDQIQFF